MGSNERWTDGLRLGVMGRAGKLGCDLIGPRGARPLFFLGVDGATIGQTSASAKGSSS